MTVKEFLYQWWMLKSVTDHEGKAVRRVELLYHEPVICNNFYIEYYSRDIERFHFDWYFTKKLSNGDTFVGCNGWHTSSIVEIKENDEELIVTTRNSVYTFVKIDNSIFTILTNGYDER